MSQLNTVEANISIGGKECNCISLTLKQTFNNHHQFEIELDYEELESKWMDNPIPTFKLIGEEVIIRFSHQVTGEGNNFSGIITSAAYTGQHGEQNYILISGASPTILLDGNPTMNSFINTPLSTVVQEAVESSGNGASVTVDPAYNEVVDYICQYGESAFEFLNRMSWEYGEWFFYSGTDIYFGNPRKSDKSTVVYDEELTHFKLSANLAPAKFGRYHYLNHQDHETETTAPDTVPGARGYLQVALNKSNEKYTSDALLPITGFVNDKRQLDILAKAEKSKQVGEMLVFDGRSQTCKIGIGKSIEIKLPSTMSIFVKDVETFLITEVVHTISQQGYYSNSFKGILNELENIPMAPPVSIHAGAEIATVMDNADDKGRIKVQFQWQKRLNKSTNWIRVQTPDAGKSDSVANNRGFVFIPEIGDRVMVGYEYGHPDKPFSMGSIFSETISRGGYETNHLKSIKTRSGHTIELNDSENAETITIKDFNSNEILYDTRSKTITISTLEGINLVSKNIKIEASEDLVLSAGRDMQQSIGNNFTQATSGESRISTSKSMVISVENDMDLIANRNIAVESGKNTKMKVGAKLVQEADSTIDITAMGGKTNIVSKGNLTLKSGSKVNVANG